MNCSCGNIAERNGNCSTCNRLARKRISEQTRRNKVVIREIRKVSPKMAKALQEYIMKKKAFMKGKVCPIYPNLPVEDIHHMAGRTNELLLDERYWLAVSRKGHIKIENNPKWAKENGYSLNRLNK